MNTWKFILILLLLPASSWAGVSINLSNSMLMPLGPGNGIIGLDSINGFEPAQTCNKFIPPNTCQVLSGKGLSVNFLFNYSVKLTSDISSVELSFVPEQVEFGKGQFKNILINPTTIVATNNYNGSVNVSFEIPLFGPESSNSYDMGLQVLVIVNP